MHLAETISIVSIKCKCFILQLSFIIIAVHEIWFKEMHLTVAFSIESGLYDIDNLGHFGHFFDGSSKSRPQTTSSGCNSDF